MFISSDNLYPLYKTYIKLYAEKIFKSDISYRITEPFSISFYNIIEENILCCTPFNFH